MRRNVSPAVDAIGSLMDGGALEIHGDGGVLARVSLEIPAFKAAQEGQAELRKPWGVKGEATGRPKRWRALSVSGRLVMEGDILRPGSGADEIAAAQKPLQLDNDIVEPGVDVGIRRLVLRARR